MKQLFSYIRGVAFLGWLSFSMVACNNHDAPFVGGGTGTGNDTGIPGLASDVLGLFAYNGGTEVETNVWSEGRTLGLFITKDSLDNPYENDRNTYFNVKCLYTKEGWQTDPKVINLSDRPAVIYAYAPYRNNVDPYFVPVECESGEFYMYGTHLEPQTSVRKGDNIAKIHMRHAMALVDFRIKKLDWDGEIELQRVVIRRKASTDRFVPSDSLVAVPDSTNALPVEGVLNIQTGVLTRTGYGQHDSGKLSAIVTEDFNTSARYVQTVLPMELEKDMVEIVFTLNGFEKSITLREGKDWTAGTRSIINLTFTGEGFEIEESIKPWQDVEQDIFVNT